jgi:site-specific recombinase XerD
MNKLAITHTGRPSVSWEDLVTGFFTDYRGQSRKTYEDGFSRFANFCGISGDMKVDQVPDAEMVKLYRDSLLDEGRSPHTVNLYLSIVRAFYTYLNTWIRKALRSGVLTADRAIEFQLMIEEVTAIKNVRSSSAPAKVATTVDQARALMDSIGTESHTDIRDRAMIALLVGCGLRRIEIARALVGDLEVNGQVILRIQQKGHHAKDGVVVIKAGVERELRAWLKATPFRDPDSPLFPSLHRNAGSGLDPRSISRIIRKRLDVVGLSEQSTHSLRHAFATIAIQNGSEIRDVQRALGHNSVTTTERYVHNLERLEGRPEQIVNDAVF